MPGRSSQSPALRYVAALIAVVAVIGTAALGWEWGGTDDPLPVAIAVVAVVLAVGATLYSKLA